MTDKNTWMFATSIDSDHWRFADSRDEAISEAKQMSDDEEGDEFVIASAVKQPPIPASIADELLERMDERWAEETGSDDYMFERVPEEQKDDLDSHIQVVFDAWCKRFNYEIRDWYMPTKEVTFIRDNLDAQNWAETC